MKNALEYYLFRALSRVARSLPFRRASRIGAALGALAFRAGFRRGVALENLRHAFPEKDERELRAIAVGAYRSYGTAMTQMLWSAGAGPDELRSIIHVDNPEIFHGAYREGRGVVLLSGHFGAWELMTSSLALSLNVQLVVIAQRQRNARVNDFVDSIRQRFGSSVVHMGIATRRVFQALREGRALGMLGDQSGPRESEFVEFFGRPAATHRGPASFALKARAPMLFLALVRREDETYDARLENVDFSDLKEYSAGNVRELTRRHVAVLERWIRKHPDHWLWMHRRWKHSAYYEKQVLEQAGSKEEPLRE
jgi:Kdo2-lipid IVA lauroyltransferase/acyltransferase